MIHGRLKALPAHVHHETTPVPGPWSSRVRRPLFKQRRERYRYRSLIYKLPVFRWSGATARYSCFRVPVETGTPPRRRKLHIPCPSAGAGVRSFRCSASPQRTRSAGLRRGPHFALSRSTAQNRAKSALKAPSGAGALPCPQRGHTAPHRPLHGESRLLQGTAYCGRKIRQYSSGPDTRCRHIISPH